MLTSLILLSFLLFNYSKIGFIREAFPLRSKEDITLVLQSCDYDVEATIACFTNGKTFFLSSTIYLKREILDFLSEY